MATPCRGSANALTSLRVPHRHFSQPLQRHEERFFIPSNRVSDCRASRATRNEDWPDSSTVKQLMGTEETKKMKKITLCAVIGTALQLLARIGLWLSQMKMQSFSFASFSGDTELAAKAKESYFFYAGCAGISELLWLIGLVMVLCFFVAIYFRQCRRNKES